MTKNIQDIQSALEDLIKIQRDCLPDDAAYYDYMHGILNGLICAHSVVSDQSPRYYSGRRPKKTNVRHKCRNERKRHR